MQHMVLDRILHTTKILRLWSILCPCAIPVAVVFTNVRKFRVEIPPISNFIVRGRELRPDDGAPYRVLPYKTIFPLSGFRRTYATESGHNWGVSRTPRGRERSGWRSPSPGYCWRCERLRLVPPRASRGHIFGTLGSIPTLPLPC